MKVTDIMQHLAAKHPGEAEYLQAVEEVLVSIEEVYNQHPEYEKAKIVERMVEPDRIFTFRVTWVDDQGQVQTNLGYRVQFNSAIGPYTKNQYPELKEYIYNQYFRKMQGQNVAYNPSPECYEEFKYENQIKKIIEIIEGV